MILRPALAGALLLASVTVQAAAAPRVLPLDEAVQDPDLMAFRLLLQEAVAEQDLDFVLAQLDPAVITSHDGREGIDDFRRQWRVEEGAPELWPVLGRLLASGGLFEHSRSAYDGTKGCGPGFAAPWWIAAWPEGLANRGTAVALGPAVPVHPFRDERKAPLAHLAWEVVRIGESAAGWSEVVLEDGRSGYARTERLGRPRHGWVLFLQECEGRWRIKGLAHGDE